MAGGLRLIKLEFEHHCEEGPKSKSIKGYSYNERGAFQVVYGMSGDDELNYWKFCPHCGQGLPQNIIEILKYWTVTSPIIPDD